MSHPRVVAELITAQTPTPGAAERVVDLETLAARCAELRRRGLTVAHCHGCFDLMHPGHIKHFEAARRFADVLVVTVTPDRYIQKGTNRPAFAEELRAYSIASLACVELVAINRWPTAVETIKLLRPTYFVKGQEFETLQDATGKLQQEVDAVREVGAQLRFTREPVFSSTALLAEHFGLEDRRAEQRTAGSATAAPKASVQALVPVAELMAQLDVIAGLRVCVIGDTIIDEYHYCEPLGMASKSSVVAHRRHAEEAHAGGILAIANHVAEICPHLSLISVLGAEDAREQFLRAQLNPRIAARFFHRPDAPSVVKRRYLSRTNHQKLFEVNSLPSAFLSEEGEDEIIAHLDAVLPGFDLVLVADYGHGFLSERIVAALAHGARRLAVNTQTNSANTGFNLITRYPRADIVCLDEHEARLAAGSRDGAIETLARGLAQRVKADAFVVTLGRRGCMAVDGAGEALFAPLLADTALVDATGAGDAFLSYCAPALAAGLKLSVATNLGNAAGALAVQIVGNRRPVSRTELIAFLSGAPAPAEVQVPTPAGLPPSAPLPIAAAPLAAAAPVGRAELVAISTKSDRTPRDAPRGGHPEVYYRDFVDRARNVVVTDAAGRGLEFAAGVMQASAVIAELRASGRKLMLIGNGASAAIGSHMAADFAKNGQVRAMTFNDAALLTAVSNDLTYEQVFEAPLRLFADPGDLLLAISSSGRSPNILAASRTARALGCRLITLSGFGEDNPLRTLGDLNFHVPCLSYGVTEVLHHSLCHCILDTFMNDHNGGSA